MSAIVLRSGNVARFTILAGPSIGGPVTFRSAVSGTRHFSIFTKAKIQSDSKSQSSLSLQPRVREAEKSQGPVVGSEGKGVEGPHYQGRTNPLYVTKSMECRHLQYRSSFAQHIIGCFNHRCLDNVQSYLHR